MKNILKLLIVTLSLAFVACDDPQAEIAPMKSVVYAETFNPSPTDFIEDSYLNLDGWTSFAQTGSIQWTEQDDDNGYMQFTTFQGLDAVNVAWAITPKINLDNSTNEILNFKSASEFVTNSANKLEVYISSDFDGTNVLAATWIPLNAIVANNNTNISSSDSDGKITIDSGDIDISTYTGNVYIGFKATGSGTNTNLDGSLRVDNIKIYDKTLK